EANTPASVTAMAAAFPEGYRDSFAPEIGLADAASLLTLSPDDPIAVDFHPHQDERAAALKIYSLGSPVALSQRVPLLENMGFRVISEQTFEMHEKGGEPMFIHDMEIVSGHEREIDLADGGALFEEMFLAVWKGLVDDDRYNGLGHTGGMTAA